ncbi:hypothetical protein MFFC18_41470 [Mariniblastus fucicola]|uniref:Uncharacterized protein n=1 Tax=Mariniblastus fucicola TaxID=980251 RepID=A0A5B9PG65_9BACT|nr:hypothetical protein MFFC18_41470 [Mariniblastus fucicola]
MIDLCSTSTMSNSTRRSNNLPNAKPQAFRQRTSSFNGKPQATAFPPFHNPGTFSSPSTNATANERRMGT